MINTLKHYKKKKKSHFQDICRINNLAISYNSNKNEFGILKSIFAEREYSDYFPFYKQVNIIDIGAHYGYFSIFAHLNTSSESKIISVEPNKNNFVNLQKNIKDCKISNIDILNFAVGGKNGTTKLYKGQNPNHSIIEDYKLANEKTSYQEIEVKTLEQIIKENNINKIDFLKIDCEGAEYSIFENTSKEIFEKITTISMEFHDLKSNIYTPEFLIKTLVENDFEIVKYNFQKTSCNLNFGKIIGTKVLKAIK